VKRLDWQVSCGAACVGASDRLQNTFFGPSFRLSPARLVTPRHQSISIAGHVSPSTKRQDLSANEVARALISMMARSMMLQLKVGYIDARPITTSLFKIFLLRTAGPYTPKLSHNGREHICGARRAGDRTRGPLQLAGDVLQKGGRGIFEGLRI
jgi:hypothetical protein